jgi:Ca-activated chloride channel family protein
LPPPSTGSRDAGHATSAAAPAAIAPDAPPDPKGTWIGASASSDYVLTGSRDTFLGVWVDVPNASRRVRAPLALALVVDTSGSMAGAKIDNAKAAARRLVGELADGDIVELTTFSDEARERVAPTQLDASSRQRVLATIDELSVGGGTNMFEGFRLGGTRILTAPSSHPIRRIVVISDGLANVGPASPEVLGELAARGADHGLQVTGIGVGLDYDERTLNALAVRSSGRLYHMTEPREMTAILRRELELLQATSAVDAFVEVVPAPGVKLVGADNVRADWVGSALRLPLGTMFGGQRREFVVRVQAESAAEAGTRPLASVRLHFRDPAENNLERVQEVVAHYAVTSDSSLVERHANARTQSIMAVQDAASVAIGAAQRVGSGDFALADKELAAVEAKLDHAVRATQDAREKRKLEEAASGVRAARKSAQAVSAAPAAARPEAQKDAAKRMNSRAMMDLGF